MAIRQLTALNMPQLEGRVPEEAISGHTPDISPYAQFNWYEYVWYHDPIASFPYKKKPLGRWLSVAECSIDIMVFYILTASGKVIVRKSIWALTTEEMQSPPIQAIIAGLDLAISNKIGDTISDAIIDPELKSNFPAPPSVIFDDNEALDEPEDPDGTRVEVDNFTPEA
jgi:hypothetical protein